MAFSLGEIVVRLTLNAAEFLQGFSAAGIASKKFGREFEDSFRSLGGIASQALAPLGEFGSFVGETLGRVGELGAGLSKMGGALGAVGVAGGLAAGAIAAVSVGSLALAVHTAESIAKIGEMAQAAGLAVGPLSGLLFVFKASGVDAEAGVKGIGKLDKSIFAAATSAAGSVNAFSRMGISVRDAQGQIKNADVIFSEVAGKFVTMQDGAVKTALAMALFGKGGAALVPALNKGKEGIEELIETAKVLGVYLDEETVKAADQFKESLKTIEAAGTGLTYRLTKELLPALNTVADFLVNGLKDKQSGLNDVINSVAYLTKAFLGVGNTIFSVLEQIGLFVGNSIAYFEELYSTLAKSDERASKFDFSGAVTAWQEGRTRMKAIDQQLADGSKKIWQDNADFVNGVFTRLKRSPTGPFQNEGKDRGDALAKVKPAKEDTILASIKERIAKLVDEAAAWAKVATAGTQAEALIQEAQKKGTEEFDKLKAQAAKDSKHPEALAFVLQSEDLIKVSAASSFLDEKISKLRDSLHKQTGDLGQQSVAALALASAYQQGGTAIANAAIDAKFSKDSTELLKFQTVLATLPPELSKNAAFVASLAEHIGKLSSDLQAAKDAERDYLANSLTADLAKETSSFAALRPFITAVSDAYLQGERALRSSRIELELQKFVQDEYNKGIVVTQAQIQTKRKILDDADRQAHTDAIQQEAARFDLNLQYDEEIKKLAQIREALQAVGASTLLVDAAEFDAQNRLLKQWDDAVFKVGTFGQKVQGVFNELIIQGRDAGAQIAGAFLTAIDSAETGLAKILTGQKANFKQIFQNLAESVTKAQIQQVVGKIAGGFGLDLGKLGLGAKPDGSAGKAFHVIVDSGIPGIQGLGSSAGLGGVFGQRGGLGGILGGIGSAIGGFFGKGSLPFTAGALGAPTAIQGVTGATGSSFGFGPGGLAGIIPGLAGGGKMWPGRDYLTGEKGMEVVRGPGTVIPMDKLGKSGPIIHQTNNFNLAQPVDMFKRSSSQLLQQIHRTSSMAYARSG